MKKNIRKWFLRLTATALLLFGLLIGLVLSPSFLYANLTIAGNYNIYHNKSLDNNFLQRLDAASELIKASELYNTKLKLDICLNDDSKYPAMIQTFRGAAFAWGFYNKVVMMGNANFQDNYVELNGYKWNLTHLLAHEMIHCFQFDKYGLYKSNPVANYPEWKWEGYPEYIARKKEGNNLISNIDRLVNTEKTVNNNWIMFEDGTGTVIPYYKNCLLVQFCLDVKKLSYDQLLNETKSEQATTDEMMKWYYENKPLN